MLADERVPVLLVDDDEAFLGTMGDILRLHGFTPRMAANGRDALDALGQVGAPPAVAVVDLGLPDMDGLDLAARLQKRHERLQVVILTGNASVESAVRALRDQRCDYLVKPVAPEQLVQTLRFAADRWRLLATEEELESSQALLEAIFEASPLPIMVLDTDRTVRLWNGAAERVFGWSAEEIRGRRSPTLRLDDDGDATETAIVTGALAGESFTGVEARRRRRDGTILDVRLSAAGLRGRSGPVEAVLVIYEDMTEQRRIEEHLREAQKLDAVGRLAAGVAHDFNNLLAVVLSEVDLALDYDRLTADLRDALLGVRRTVERGTALTRQLLTFARRQSTEPVVVDPNQAVRSIRRMLQRLVGEHVQLVEDLAEDVWSVKVDRGQLDQVIANLVVNARDAMDRKGRVTLRTRNVALDEEGSEQAVLDQGDWVVLSVSDRGTGIPDFVMERLFEPFFTTKEEEGTGLGLATCHGIVERFGGVITVDSKVGQGSTFSVWLPRVAAGLAAEGGTEGDRAPTGNETILLVEDNLDLQGVTRRMLARLGYEVFTASSGIEARRMVEELPSPPDLVVCDGHLPDDDGRVVVERLRESVPDLKALLVSGSLELMDRTPVDLPFLAKPYTLQSLARAIREALAGEEPPRAGEHLST